MLSNVPGALYMILLSSMTILQGQYYYCYFTDMENKLLFAFLTFLFSPFWPALSSGAVVKCFHQRA